MDSLRRRLPFTVDSYNIEPAIQVLRSIERPVTLGESLCRIESTPGCQGTTEPGFLYALRTGISGAWRGSLPLAYLCSNGAQGQCSRPAHSFVLRPPNSPSCIRAFREWVIVQQVATTLSCIDTPRSRTLEAPNVLCQKRSVTLFELEDFRV